MDIMDELSLDMTLLENELIHIEGEEVVSWNRCSSKKEVDSVMVQLLCHLDPFQQH